jgi:uncharacterized repeat protein (TIGR02543 family)
LSDEAVIEAVTSAPAAGEEYDGYIVKLSEDGGDAGAGAESADYDVIADGVVAIDEPEDALDFAEAGDVEYIEPNYKLTFAAFPEDDPRDWMYTHRSNYQWGIKYVGAKTAWQSGYDGAGVNIAIIDSGVAYAHEDFDSSKIIDSYDFIGGKSEAVDDHMHGAAVTGIIAAETDNVKPGEQAGTGIAGLTERAGLLIYKVLDGNGDGYRSDVIKAYDRILKSEKRVDVINISLGHTNYSKTESDIVGKLVDKGIIVVAAAGNNGDVAGPGRNEVYYPAGYDGVIGVGSIGERGVVSSFSAKNSSVDVVAPGEGIAGFSNIYMSGATAYGMGSGTSFAAPIVAAAAAMAKQSNRNFNAASFMQAIRTTVTDAGSKGYDTSYGYGVLSLTALTNYIDKLRTPDGAPGSVPPAASSGVADPDGGDVKDDGSPSGDDGGKRDEVREDDRRDDGGGVVKDDGDAGKGDDAKTNVDKALKKFRVKFAVNGGKRLAKSKRYKTVSPGTKYGKLPSPKRKGYRFRGWYTKPKSGARVKATTVVKMKKAHTLYAHWKRNSR